MMSPATSGNLASRFLEPLAHPWTAVTGGVLSAGIVGSEMPVAVLRVALRLLRLLLAL
jgi:hypothetical protein